MADDGWTERLWQWAEKNGIDDNVLPRNKKDLTNLTKLDFSGCQLKFKLPKEIGNLTNLTTLNLSGYELTELPKEIGNLTNLTRLYIDSNKHPEEWGSGLSEIRNLSDLTKRDDSMLGEN